MYNSHFSQYIQPCPIKQERKSSDIPKGTFFRDVNPSRNFYLDAHGGNIENPSFLENEGGAANQSQLRQSFLNNHELGNISVISAHHNMPDQSVDIDLKAINQNILNDSVMRPSKAELGGANLSFQKEDNNNGLYRIPEKVVGLRKKKNKYAELNESQEGDEPSHYETHKQYEDKDIDLEYNFNNLIQNIENFNPDLFASAQTQNTAMDQAAAAQANANARNENGQNPANQQTLQIDNDPEISPEELIKIHESYLDIYTYMALFYLFLFGVVIKVLPYYTVFVLLWLFDILVCRKQILEYRQIPADQKGKRRKIVGYAVECFVLATCKGYIMYALEVNKNLYISYVIIPLLVYTFVLCVIVGFAATNADAAWLALRVLFYLQALMVCLKIDGLITWDWRGVFWLYWFTFFLVVFYCAGLLLILTCLVYFLLVGQIKPYQFCGLFWLFLFLAGNAGITFGVIMGFVEQTEDPKNDLLLGFSVLGGIFQQLLMLLFSSVFKLQMLKFYLQILKADSPSSQRKTRKEITYEKEQEREKYPGFLIMFSPTYFMTYEQKVKLKKQKPAIMAKLQAKKLGHTRNPTETRAKLLLQELEGAPRNTKHMLATPTFGEKINLLHSRKSTSSKLISFPETQGDEVMREHPANEEGGSPFKMGPKHRKSALSNSFIDQRTIDQMQRQLQREKILEKLQRRDDEAKITAPESPGKQSVNMSIGANAKFVFSENDLDCVENEGNLSQLFANSPKKAKEQSEQCLVCFDRAPNAVMMNCGHGGLCYECAMDIWKKTHECYICRRPIQKMLQIDPHAKKWGVTKVLGSTKMVTKEVEDSQAYDTQVEGSRDNRESRP